ncbi:MAG: crossover junction endodeoxyribonuclease RuvC, partial [Campylobacterales bacterium]
MRVLGIDPGSQQCGFGIVELEGKRIKFVGAGVIEIGRGPLPAQLVELREGLGEVMGRYRADQVAIEEVFFAYNPQSVLKLAQFRGAIGMELLRYFSTFHSYT